jgi:pimeloyl-ACP methyl ester carboxylesterase
MRIPRAVDTDNDHNRYDTDDVVEANEADETGSDRRRRRIPRGRPALAAMAVFSMVALVVACTGPARLAEDVAQSHTEGTFYSLPQPMPAGAPGSLIRSERLLGAPDGAIAWRVLYRSTDTGGASVGVSGVIIAPTRPAPKDGWPIVSWGHPTTGAYGRCAPSVGDDPFALIEGLHELIDAGYAVAATDYPGMGADGPPSYLIGVSEGNSVLDAARAARAIPETHAGTRLLLWGHSQGGQAVLFAAQSARSYAPEFTLLGVAAAAPAAELGALLNDDIVNQSGVTLGAYAFDAYQRVYGPTNPTLQLGSILTPAGVAAIPQMAPLCLLGQNKELHAIADPLVGKFLAADPSKTEPWATLLARNTPGGQPVKVPMLVAQGLADTLVKPATTDQYVQTICATGEHVDYRTFPDITHALIAERTVPILIPWFADVVAGRPTPVTCPSRATTPPSSSSSSSSSTATTSTSTMA